MTDSDVDRTLGLLRDNGLSYVSVDEPQGFASSVPPVAAVTARTGVVRFHGRNAATWEKKAITAAERFNYDYSDAEFKEWLPRIEQLAEQAQELHLLMNNCHEDKAVNDARQLGSLLSTMRPDLDFTLPSKSSPSSSPRPGPRQFRRGESRIAIGSHLASTEGPALGREMIDQWPSTSVPLAGSIGTGVTASSTRRGFPRRMSFGSTQRGSRLSS
jgi:hypothetical protein